jgi:hypothetical protein
MSWIDYFLRMLMSLFSGNEMDTKEPDNQHLRTCHDAIIYMINAIRQRRAFRISVSAGTSTAMKIFAVPHLPESPRVLPAEFPLFLIFFLKCDEQIAVNAAAFIKEDFQIEFMRAVFHRDDYLICTQLGKSDIAEFFFNAVEGKITAA